MTKNIVTGVDGNFGRIVADTIQSLIPKENVLFTAPTSNKLEKFSKAGIATATADFNDVRGLASTFENADTVLLISMPFVGEKRRQAHKNVVDACVKANVKKIIYTSLVNATDPMMPSIEKIDHAWTESYIETTDLDYIFLRNSQYAEAMITNYFAIADSGVLANNDGKGKMAYISREDCAIAAAHAMANPYLHHAILNINGPEQLTMAEFLNVANQVTGNSVKYQEVSDDEQYAIFDKMGVPRTTEGKFKKGSTAPFSSEGMVTFGQSIRNGQMEIQSPDFQRVVGRKPHTVKYMFEHSDQYQIGDRHSVDD